jgi:hypothetical protein
MPTMSACLMMPELWSRQSHTSERTDSPWKKPEPDGTKDTMSSPQEGRNTLIPSVD